MKRALVIAIFALAAAGGCDRKRPPAPPAAPPAETKDTWAAEDIAKDPQGYLVWSQKKVETQVADRERRLTALGARRADWDSRRSAFEQSLSDLENLRRRLEEAYQRADDEDRWPLKFAGRSLSRDKARWALEQLQKAIDDRTPDRKMYETVLAKMDEASNAYRNDIQQLNRLRQKMEADLEQVRLTQDMAIVHNLRKSEDQLASMSKAVAGMSDEPLGLPAAKPTTPVSLEDILNK